MKQYHPVSPIWLWSAMIVVMIAVIVTVIVTNITLRSVEKNLPNTLLREVLDLALVLEDLADAVSAAEITNVKPNTENFARLRTKVQIVFDGVVELRNTYVFDNLIQASAFHAVVAPAISDLQIWLSEGVSGYGPESEVTAAIILTRISEAFQKAKTLNRDSQIKAQKILDEQRHRLDRFLFSVNLLFMLTLVITFILILLFIRQNMLRSREMKTRTELQNQRDLLNSLFENLLLGITVCDREGRLLHTNKGFTDLTGYSTMDISSLNEWFLKAYPDSDYRKEVLEDWEQAAESAGAVREFRVTCKNGQVKDIEFRGTFLPDGRALVTMADITDRKKAEEDKERLQVQLQQAQKMEAVGTLTSGIAHDFNNILQAIGGNIQLILAQKGIDHRIVKYSAAVVAAVDLAADLVRSLLTSSRRIEPKLKALNVREELQQAIGMLERTIPKMINIETRVSEDIHLICADANQFSQVLINLVTNARDAMPDGGQLFIRTANVTLDHEFCVQNIGAAPGDYVRITVSDTGVGMSEGTLKNIFNPFFTTKELGKGTGLGMAIVYGIITNHGGYMICDSAPGQGATFTIYWPVAPKERMELVLEEAPKVLIRGGDELILVVDDEDAILEIAEEVLTDNGYSVVLAGSGEKALEIYKESKNEIKLVIMDLGMPGIGGHKAMVELLKVDPKVRIIISSGYSADNQVEEALAAGALGFVGKPYKLDDMLGRIRETLDS